MDRTQLLIAHRDFLGMMSGPPALGVQAPGAPAYPPPYSVKKFLVFNRIQLDIRCKILITKEFAAES
jgi:hypothetical protein